MVSVVPNAPVKAFRILQILPLIAVELSRLLATSSLLVRVVGPALSTTSCWGTCDACDDQVSLVPFHGLSSAIRSLLLESTRGRPFEDFGLLVFGSENEIDGYITLTTPPRLTGPL